MTGFPGIAVSRPGLIWGFDFTDGAAKPVADADLSDGQADAAGRRAEGNAFRWLHVNITDQSNCRWIEGPAGLPAAVREMILSPDTHQRALVADGFVACVLHDFEVDFGTDETSRVGALRVALSETTMITARHHPLFTADVVKRRIDAGVHPQRPA